MSISYRRYEILIPSRYNDGREIPEGLFVETLFALRNRFGAVSSETQVIEGEWENAGTVYRDQNFRMFVDVPDTAEHREFFLGFKAVLKERFAQLEIWITSHPIDVL